MHLFGEHFIFFGAVLVVVSILTGILSNRIGAFSNLPIKGLDELTLQKRVQEIGHMPGSFPR